MSSKEALIVTCYKQTLIGHLLTLLDINFLPRRTDIVRLKNQLIYGTTITVSYF